jgi:hypothetical protein
VGYIECQGSEIYFLGKVILMTKTLIDIPEDLMEAARAVIGKDATKAETVRTALQEMVQRHRQRTAVDWFTETDVVADLRDSEVRASARR